jgi:hypothetical protein
MAEKIISPGVFTNEIDQSFLPAAVADIGAALIGPTVKGPAGVPTIVTSFSDFQQKFGDVFKSGSTSVQYLTSHTAEQYLKNSDTLTVVRVLDGTYGPATTNDTIGSQATSTGATFASASLTFTAVPSGSVSALGGPDEITIGSTKFMFVSESAGYTNSSTQIFVEWADPDAADTVTTTATAFKNAVNQTITTTNLGISASSAAGVVILSGSSAGTQANLTMATGSGGDTFSTTPNFVSSDSSFLIQGGTDTTTTSTSFKLQTIADGEIMNNSGSALVTTNNVLLSGSQHNIRWEISNTNNKKGTFTLLIRRGDDSHKRKQILETFSNLSLDPNSTNYIGKRVGDQINTLRTSDGTFLQLSGSFPNKSKFVTVHNPLDTLDYIDENGNVRLGSLSASLPAVGSGSSHGAFSGGSNGYAGFDPVGNPKGDNTTNYTFYEDIDTNSQGFNPETANQGLTGYTNALDLISNQDEYDVNLILVPGIIGSVHTKIASKVIDVCEDRADCFAVVDPVPYGMNIADATSQAETRDSNFAAMYWPWVKVPDTLVAGTQRWVPPSVVMGGIYAFNDKVAHPWFAPAGLNRGGIDVAIQAERKLTQANRDTLYDSNVNPIATFPGQGVTVFGQKTLQKKSSALDRINVRRLLIRVKKFIASSSRFLVFEQNTAATRRRFLGIVNPFLENVQSQSGLSAFRVVMDETNNTPDTIDRNQLVGQLFLQPTRTAEFIVLDFTIQPTGAAFPE